MIVARKLEIAPDSSSIPVLLCIHKDKGTKYILLNMILENLIQEMI